MCRMWCSTLVIKHTMLILNGYFQASSVSIKNVIKHTMLILNVTPNTNIR